MNKLGLIVITAMLTACGGGGGGSTATNTGGGGNTGATLSISPSLGKFSSGTVKIYAADGSTLATGSLTNGMASLSATAGCVPAIIEVSNGTFYDEGTNAASAMNSLPLRAALSCFSTQNNAAVTALTELAFQKLGTARDTASIDAANEYIRVKYGNDLTSILTPPALVGSTSDAQALAATEAGKYALRLAAFAVVAKKYGQNTMSLVNEAGKAVASSGYIDGSNSTTFSNLNFVADFNAALVSFATTSAPNLVSHASTNASLPTTTTAIPSILKTNDFKQLMRLLVVTPKNYLLFPEYAVANPTAPLPVYNCGDASGNGLDTSAMSITATTVNYTNCLTMPPNSGSMTLFPYGLNGANNRILINGIGSQVLNQPASSSSVTLNLSYADPLTGNSFGVVGTATNITPNPAAASPASWVSTAQPCRVFEYRNAAFTIGSGADAISLSNLNVCGNDDSLSNVLSATRTLTYIVSGNGVAGRAFSNVATPLIFTQNTGLGTVAGQTVNRVPVLVSGSLTYPTSTTDAITLAANANGTATITKTTPTSTSSATVPITMLLDRAIY
jgi:hypothetical protein